MPHRLFLSCRKPSLSRSQGLWAGLQLLTGAGADRLLFVVGDLLPLHQLVALPALAAQQQHIAGTHLLQRIAHRLPAVHDAHMGAAAGAEAGGNVRNDLRRVVPIRVVGGNNGQIGPLATASPSWWRRTLVRPPVPNTAMMRAGS